MKKTEKAIDRGKFLKTIVEKSGISITALVKKAGYKDRASYYAHISKPDLSFEILAIYAKVLKYDLRSEFPEMSNFIYEDPFPDFNTNPETLEQAKNMLTVWKDKYFQLLEKYVEVIEQRNRQTD